MGRQTGLDRSTVANLIRLLELPETVKTMLRDGSLSMGHGRTLLSLHGKTAIETAARLAVSREMSVRALESHVRRISAITRRPAARSLPAETSDLQERLTRRLSARVRIRDHGGKGSVVIEYTSLGELERILEIIDG
jgi:ParB family chromosome partitioning protein